MNWRDRHLWLVIASGLAAGLSGVLLSLWGNPENSGICVSCFFENSAGALGLHNNERMQYLRPELIGFLLGALGSAVAAGEFRARGGSSPLLRVMAGVLLIVGGAVFIGCPIKLVLRLTAGDLSAVGGVAGLVAGVWLGLRGLRHGVTLGRPAPIPLANALVTPLLFAFLLLLVLLKPGFVLEASHGSAARHAPPLAALGVALGLGVLAQRSRFCITGGVRDAFLLGRRSPLLWGLLAFLAGALLLNLASGRFHGGFYGQPGSHTDLLWSGMGMLLVGWVSTLIGGCPFRQLIKSGEGDGDAGLVVFGMLLGGGLVQSWGIAATASGVAPAGKIAVLAGLALTILITLYAREE